jgi:hypothetical protein
METLGNITQQNSAKKFCCKFCDYNTDRKCNFDAHLISKRHVINSAMETNGNQIQRKFSEINYSCEKCQKQFKNRSGLWKHKKNCKNVNNINNKDHENLINKDELIMLLVKQNAELIKEHTDIKNMMIEQQNMMIKVIENGTHNTNITNTNTNSHNKAFNLNFFLNETCKNAMNINDFVDSIKLQLSDLMEVGELGYVEGISKIIVKNLNALDETERPVHCTDKKRETIYIKDQGQWEREDDNKSKLKKAINKIAHKNIKLISQFREKYPDYKKYESNISDKYNKMIIEAMGGAGNNNAEKEDKIIKKITKATTISQKYIL